MNKAHTICLISSPVTFLKHKTAFFLLKICKSQKKAVTLHRENYSKPNECLHLQFGAAEVGNVSKASVETDSKANECSHLQFAAAEVGDVRFANVETASKSN